MIFSLNNNLQFIQGFFSSISISEKNDNEGKKDIESFLYNEWKKILFLYHFKCANNETQYG